MNRKKLFFKKICDNISFSILNLNIARGITVTGSVLGILSLFLTWFNEGVNNKGWNSFSTITGNIGYIDIIFLIIILIIIFGENYKEKMKLYSEIDFKNYIFVLFVGVFMLLTGIIEVRYSIGIESFGKEIKHGNGLVLSVVSSIFLIVGGYLIRQDFYKNSSEIILNKLKNKRENEKKRKNLNLPF